MGIIPKLIPKDWKTTIPPYFQRCLQEFGKHLEKRHLNSLICHKRCKDDLVLFSHVFISLEFITSFW